MSRSDRTARRLGAGIVPGPDLDLRIPGRRIDQPQPARLPGPAGGIEERHVMKPATLRGDVVSDADQPVLRARIREYVEVKIAQQDQPPIALAAAETGAQPLGRVAGFQIVRTECDGAACANAQGDRTEGLPGIVRREDPNVARLRSVGDAQAALVHRLPGRQEQEHGSFLRPRRGEVGERARGRIQQRHRLDGHVGEHQQLPVARAVAEPARQPGRAVLKLPGGHRPRRPGREHGRDLPRRQRIRIVHAEHGDLRRGIRGVDQPQRAAVGQAVAGRQQRDPVIERAARHHVVEAVHEAGLRARVGQRLDIQRRVQHQPPVALAAADARGDPQRPVAPFQVRGAELKGLPGVQLKRYRPEGEPRIVDGRDRHHARFIGVVDDANHPFAQGIGCGRQQGKAVGFRRGKERHEQQWYRQRADAGDRATGCVRATWIPARRQVCGSPGESAWQWTEPYPHPVDPTTQLPAWGMVS